MNVNAFKKKFREQLKEKKLKMRISESEKSTKITDQYGSSFYVIYRIRNEGYCNNQWKRSGSNKNPLTFTLLYWENLASVEKRPFVSFFHNRESELSEILQENGYGKLDQYLSKEEIDMLTFQEIKCLNGDKEFVKELIPGFFKKLALVDQKIESFSKKMKEKDSTFEAERFSNRECLNSVPFYYKGHRETLYLSFKENQFVLENNDKQPICSFDETTDLDALFGEKLDALEKKMRLKNIYSPPKKHFYTYLKPLSLSESDEETKTIYEVLTQRYSPEEIEIFASKIKRCYYKQLDTGALFKFLDVYFLYNYTHIPVLDDVYHFENEETLIENLKMISEKELSYLREQRNKELESLKETLHEL